MRDVYAARFQLTQPDAFERGRRQIADWCLRRYPTEERPDPSAPTTLKLNETDSLEWSTLASEVAPMRAWSAMWRHSDHEDTSLGWRVLAQLTDSGDGVTFTLRLSQESLEARVRPAVEVPGRPLIVRDLARDLGGFADGRLLEGRSQPILTDDVTALRDLLMDPARRLPVLVTSISGTTFKSSADPDGLADQLIGIAHVASLMTIPASYELTDQVGRTLSVFEGAVRIYWPGLSDNSDPYFHRLWLARTVEMLDVRASFRDRPVGFSRHLLGLVADVAALRISPDPLVRTLMRESEARVQAEERIKWDRLAADASLSNEFAQEFDKQAARIRELETAKEELERELDELERERDQLVANFAIHQVAVDRERQVEEEFEVPPVTIREAVERVAATYPDSIVVLDEAVESACETRYPHMRRAYDAILAVGRVAQGWHENSLGMDFDTAFDEAGYTLRTVSSITQHRHAKDYGRTYDSQRILLGPHLALGDGGSTDTIFRVYWYLDEKERRFVVGHVGRHLPDSST